MYEWGNMLPVVPESLDESHRQRQCAKWGCFAKSYGGKLPNVKLNTLSGLIAVRFSAKINPARNLIPLKKSNYFHRNFYPSYLVSFLLTIIRRKMYSFTNYLPHRRYFTNKISKIS